MKVEQLLTEAGGATLFWYDFHEDELHEFEGFHETYAKNNFQERMKQYENDFDSSVYAKAFTAGYVRAFYEDERFILNVEGYEEMAKAFLKHWRKHMLRDHPVEVIYADYFHGHLQGYSKESAVTPRDVRKMLSGK